MQTPARSERIRGAGAVLALPACLALFACASAPAPDSAGVLRPSMPALPLARTTPLRATAGVFYTPQFAHGTLTDRGTPAISHRPGPASVALFDHVLGTAFGELVRLPAWPASSAPPGVSLVFVPRVVAITTIRQATPPFSARLIEYGVEVHTPTGERLDGWTLYARSRADGQGNTDEDRLSSGALRDAAAQLLAALARRPALLAQVPATRQTEVSGPDPRAARAGPVRLAVTSLFEPSEARERRSPGEPDCLAAALVHAVPDASIVSAEQVRDALFPWFEASTVVDTAQQMPELMRQAAVREGVRQAGIDYMALVRTERTSNRNPDALRCDTSHRAPGCSGVRGDALKTRLQVTLWNLNRYTMSGKFEVEGAGSATFAGLTVPIPGAERSSASACERAAEAISHLIRPR